MSKQLWQKPGGWKKVAKEYIEHAVLADCDKVTAMELVLKEAQYNKENYQQGQPKVIEVQRADEEPALRRWLEVSIWTE